MRGGEEMSRPCERKFFRNRISQLQTQPSRERLRRDAAGCVRWGIIELPRAAPSRLLGQFEESALAGAQKEAAAQVLLLKNDTIELPRFS